jgi:hypothetical protein
VVWEKGAEAEGERDGRPERSRDPVPLLTEGAKTCFEGLEKDFEAVRDDIVE